MKKNIFFLVLSILLYGACATEEDDEPILSSDDVFTWDSVIVVPSDYQYPEGPTFKVLSWNVEHFVDGHDDPYIDNERENSPPENMPLRRNLLIKALKKADADIVVLQEFESAKYLKQIALDSLPDMNYRFFADVPSHNWYMNVVVMSRFPMGVIYGYGNATTPLPDYIAEDGSTETQNHINTRMLSINVYPSENYSFLLTGVHLKAGRGERNSSMRKGQINLLQRQFNRFLLRNPEKNMLIVGDLNATPDSEEINLLVNNSGLIRQFSDPLDTSVYTHPSDDPTRRLDYILVNENMFPEVVDKSIQIQSFFSSDTMRIISDHLPVVGIFNRTDI
ncbi:endonuclease/exonuclease/phosphatase family protein [Fulvivirgaceae bacterium BMA10]|uniref:Endonuclease/exonuclease/phosphatase family protein n=1 Tax=Splendidivirga corallicola TaxID=3051826 RepID=A0ABT8KVE8_9BACT|nr:endonuclease/exonuclease/phosphatase family protein [Fulvivirgaceae bacterium BMA10]